MIEALVYGFGHRIHMLSQAIGQDKTMEELREMFLRIDADTSGRLTWDELSALLLTYKVPSMEQFVEKPNIQFLDKDPSRDASSEGQDDGPHFHSRHVDMVNCIQVHKHNYYYTASYDGCVKAWNANDCSLASTVQKSHSPVSSMKLFDDKYLAVATIDRVINIYGIVWYGHELVRRFVGTHVHESSIKGKGTGKGNAEGAKRKNRRGVAIHQVNLKDLVDSPSALDHTNIGGHNHLVLGLYSGGIQVYNISKVVMANKPAEIQSVRKMTNVHREMIRCISVCGYLMSACVALKQVLILGTDVVDIHVFCVWCTGL